MKYLLIISVTLNSGCNSKFRGNSEFKDIGPSFPIIYAQEDEGCTKLKFDDSHNGAGGTDTFLLDPPNSPRSLLVRWKMEDLNPNIFIPNKVELPIRGTVHLSFPSITPFRATRTHTNLHTGKVVKFTYTFDDMSVKIPFFAEKLPDWISYNQKYDAIDGWWLWFAFKVSSAAHPLNFTVWTSRNDILQKMRTQLQFVHRADEAIWPLPNELVECPSQ